MSEKTINKFDKGLVTDLHPLQTPADVLTEAKNVEFVTTEGNQLILQKRIGNDPAQYESTDVTLSSGFKPLIAKELNNIAYILSYNETTGSGEIGTFPSPDYSGFYRTPVGAPLTAPLVINASFDDGLSEIPDFTVNAVGGDTSTLWDQEYVPQISITTYTIEVTNNNTFEDSYQVQISNTTYLSSNTDMITVPAGDTGSFILSLDTDSTAFIGNMYVTIHSRTDSSIARTVDWRNLSIYNMAGNDFGAVWTIATDTGYNTSVNYLADWSVSPVLEIELIKYPGADPTKVRFTPGLSFPPPAYVELTYTLVEESLEPNDGSVTIITDVDGNQTIQSSESRKFKIQITGGLDSLPGEYGNNSFVALYQRANNDSTNFPIDSIDYDGDPDFPQYNGQLTPRFAWFTTGGLYGWYWAID